MTTQIEPPLGSYADWIRATDVHASHRLELLQQAVRWLADEEDASAGDRHDLAAALARWRYQLLNACCGQLAARDRGLAEALDLAANELAGRDPRPPRRPRAAIEPAGDRKDEIATVKACLDPAVALEDVTRRAAELTRANFGTPAAADGPGAGKRRMLLYAPLYLSSHCINHCTYCGFRYPHKIRRRHLSLEEALAEADILLGRGFRHILLVAGDFPSLTTPEYFTGIIRALKRRGVNPAIEIAPQPTEVYERLRAAGACGVTLYQETYNETLYACYHRRGTKVSFDWRLEGLERAAEAGISRLGLGILLGLADPTEDLLALMRHARYLQSRFPNCTLAFSLPRIYRAPAGFEAPYPISEETFIRSYCALRVAFPRVPLVLSTREPPALRNRLARICMTQISAGSCTSPGGYEEGAVDRRTGEQFPVSDHRSPAEVAAWLREAGFQLAWDIAQP